MYINRNAEHLHFWECFPSCVVMDLWYRSLSLYGKYEHRTTLHYGHINLVVIHFMEPGDYQDAPISKILQFIRSVGLLEGRNRGECTIDLGKVAVHGPIKAYPLFIHSFIQASLASLYDFIWQFYKVALCAGHQVNLERRNCPCHVYSLPSSILLVTIFTVMHTAVIHYPCCFLSALFQVHIFILEVYPLVTLEKILPFKRTITLCTAKCQDEL
jgi:hypothetical protein